MLQQYSIANARDQLTSLIRSVEQDQPVQLTRRGKPVAVLLSAGEYERLTSQRPSFSEAYDRFREKYDFDELQITPDLFEAPNEPPESEENPWL